jgi:predicted GTPase
MMKAVLVLLLVGYVVCNVLVIGKAGVGKSYFINALLGEDIAHESHTDDIGTHNINSYEYEGIKIFDTPGLFDTDSDPKVALRHYIKQSGASLLIYVMMRAKSD